MTIEEAISYFEIHKQFLADINLEGKIAHEMAIDALKGRQYRVKNDPLTLEELRQMDGEPVWVVDSILGNGWMLVDVRKRKTGWNALCIDKRGNIESSEFDYNRRNEDGTLHSYGWLAYRYPKGETE